MLNNEGLIAVEKDYSANEGMYLDLVFTCALLYKCS